MDALNGAQAQKQGADSSSSIRAMLQLRCSHADPYTVYCDTTYIVTLYSNQLSRSLAPQSDKTIPKTPRVDTVSLPPAGNVRNTSVRRSYPAVSA